MRWRWIWGFNIDHRIEVGSTVAQPIRCGWVKKENMMHTTLEKFRSPVLTGGSMSVNICYPKDDPDDDVDASLACWTLNKKHQHAYPVSGENVMDLSQGMTLSFLHNSELSVGASLINIDLKKLGEDADQLVFVLNDLDAFLELDGSNTFLEIWHEQVKIARIRLDLSTIGSEGSVILAVFDRYQLSWGFPGIAVHDVDLVMHDFEYGDLPAPFTREINSNFPSALGLQGPDQMSDRELLHAIKWGPAGFLRKVKSSHLEWMSLKQGEEILAHYREALSNEDIIPVRINIMKTLMKLGVDWAASISEEVGQLPHLEDKMDELIRVAHSHKAWARVITRTLSNQSLIAYASCTMKADYLYILEPRKCLMNLISESLRAQTLEQDLGL